MGELENNVNVTITAATVFPSQMGFGIPLLVGLHSVTPNMTDRYSDTAEMVDAGWPASHPLFLMAQRVFASKKRPPYVIIGKRLTSYTQVLHLIPVDTVQGHKTAFTYVDASGVATAVEYVNGPAETVATVVDGLIAVLNPLADSVVTDATTHAVITATAGKLIGLRDLPRRTVLKVKDATTNPGIGPALSAIEASGKDGASGWYFAVFDHASEASAVAIADWFQTRERLAMLDIVDSETLDGAVSTDVGTDLKTAKYEHCTTFYLGKGVGYYQSAAVVGNRLPHLPGSTIWKYATLPGIPADDLSTGEIAQLRARLMNFYVEFGGTNNFEDGTFPDGNFIDIPHSLAMLRARVRENLFAAMKQATDLGTKIDFTEDGVELAKGVIRTTILNETGPGKMLTTDSPIVVNAPKVKDVPLADRAARRLPDLTFTAQFSSGIQSFTVNGRISI